LIDELADEWDSDGVRSWWARSVGEGTGAASWAWIEARFSRAWRTVRRVWMIDVRRSSSAFLAPRMAMSRSRSPSPEARNESRMLLSDAGGAG
jgi:hypothetical protein